MSKNLDIYKEELGDRKVEDLTEYDFDFQGFLYICHSKINMEYE